ncbi:MAG: winged helix-turn-helix domain-containing protein [Ornithinibacter sp.]
MAADESRTSPAMLVVVDETASAETVGTYLERAGYDTSRADNSADAVRMARADVYVSKRYSPRELFARVQVLPRLLRARRGSEDTLEEELSSRPRYARARRVLIDEVWVHAGVGDEHLVDVHVAHLRRKLGDDPTAPRYIETVRGVGYRMGAG